MSEEEITSAQPDWGDFARIAVEFTHQRWTSECENLFPCPLNNNYWTVRLGRLALCRDGTWAFWDRLRSLGNDEESVNFVRNQRFETIEEAIVVATKVFGQTPEDGLYQQSLYGAKT